VEQVVAQRYSAGAGTVQPDLCCAVDYDPRHLSAIPQEVLDRDYGCGDPSRYLHQGETVLDLGCGGGKVCFIASQVVGRHGAVIGIDVNDDMLDLARRNLPHVAKALGYANVIFRKGRIQDLALDLETLEVWLGQHPVRDLAGVTALEDQMARLRSTSPLVDDASVDAVVSNCVLNLVATEHKAALFSEIFRVLRPGGRAVISDIVSNVEVPDDLRADPELWSGCISGAFQEGAFLGAFETAGFGDVTLDKRDEAPWRVVEGIEFRSVTVVAHKGGAGAGQPPHQATISAKTCC